MIDGFTFSGTRSDEFNAPPFPLDGPVGEGAAFAPLGDIYLLPIEGGEARAIPSGLDESATMHEVVTGDRKAKPSFWQAANDEL